MTTHTNDIPPEPPVGTWMRDRHGGVTQRQKDGWGPPGTWPGGRWRDMWRARGPYQECGPWGQPLETVREEFRATTAPTPASSAGIATHLETSHGFEGCDWAYYDHVSLTELHKQQHRRTRTPGTPHDHGDADMTPAVGATNPPDDFITRAARAYNGEEPYGPLVRDMLDTIGADASRELDAGRVMVKDADDLPALFDTLAAVFDPAQLRTALDTATGGPPNADNLDATIRAALAPVMFGEWVDGHVDEVIRQVAPLVPTDGECDHESVDTFGSGAGRRVDVCMWCNQAIRWWNVHTEPERLHHLAHVSTLKCAVQGDNGTWFGWRYHCQRCASDGIARPDYDDASRDGWEHVHGQEEER